MSLYRTNAALSVRGDRVERGAEIELSDAEVANLDPADLSLASGTPSTVDEAPGVVALEDMTHTQLKEYAKELGLGASGSKADLQERIALHLTTIVNETEITND